MTSLTEEQKNLILESFQKDPNIINITKIVFDDHCVMCLRCIHQCPAEAIQIGKMTLGKFRWHGPLGDFKPKKFVK